MGSLLQKKGLHHINIAAKLVAFGSNGINVFQGVKLGVTKQTQETFTPFSLGVHCVSHKKKLGYANIIIFSFSAWSGNIVPILISILLQKSQTPHGIHKIG
jgi:hypothetical protein